MAVSLQNLAVRAPAEHDQQAIKSLLSACDLAEGNKEGTTEEDLSPAWQQPEYQMQTDAWVIVARSGQLVGYACVWHRAFAQIEACARVHPAFRGRGIGTLLLRLVEVRGRQFAARASSGPRVCLGHTVSMVNTAACQLLEREGYTRARLFWRIVVHAGESFDELCRRGSLTFDLLIDPQDLAGSTRLNERGGYTLTQYGMYEKELRAPEGGYGEVDLDLQALLIEPAPCTGGAGL